MQTSLLVAVDTNFLLALADRDETAIDALELVRLRLRPVLILTPPTAMEEAAHQAVVSADTALSQLARRALAELRSVWHLQPAELRSEQEAIASQSAAAMRDAGLMPWQERNDALILAESAVLRCTLLVSDDSHLLDIDRPKTSRLLKQFDLECPVIESPRRLLKKFSH